MTTHITAPTLAALRVRFAELYRNAPPRGMRSAILTAAIAWKEQVLVHGDIEPALARDLAIVARECRERRLAEKARAAKPKAGEKMTGGIETPAVVAASAISPASPLPPLLPPASSQLRVGARLVRTYAGITHVVEVTGDGFVHDGQLYGSLSAVAKAITGTHWNGLLFFGLRRRKTPGGSTSKRRLREPASAKAAAHG